MIKIAIVDDEPPARARIRRILEKRACDYEIVECCDGKSALEVLLTTSVDIMFLDVQMPYMTGIEVLNKVPKDISLPAIIFTTAYKEFAIDAFDVTAVDYLLKPWTNDRFNKALDLALQRSNISEPTKTKDLASIVFTVRDANEIYAVKSSEISYIESAGNYMILHTKERQHIHRETMAALEKRLKNHHFFRSSRGYLINLTHFKSVNKCPEGKNQISIVGGAKIPLRRPIKELRSALESAANK